MKNVRGILPYPNIWSRNGRNGKANFHVSLKYQELYHEVKSLYMKFHYTALETPVVKGWQPLSMPSSLNQRRHIKDWWPPKHGWLKKG